MTQRCDGLWSDKRLCCVAAPMVRVMRKLGAEAGHRQLNRSQAAAKDGASLPAAFGCQRLRSSSCARAFCYGRRGSSGEGRSF
jgi:hypothetical protein